ncbi:hypothetical protein Tco_0843871 [Tanacetum coccineum]
MVWKWLIKNEQYCVGRFYASMVNTRLMKELCFRADLILGLLVRQIGVTTTVHKVQNYLSICPDQPIKTAKAERKAAWKAGYKKHTGWALYLALEKNVKALQKGSPLTWISVILSRNSKMHAWEVSEDNKSKPRKQARKKKGEGLSPLPYDWGLGRGTDLFISKSCEQNMKKSEHCACQVYATSRAIHGFESKHLVNGINDFDEEIKKLIGLIQSAYIDKILKMEIQYENSKKGFIPMDVNMIDVEFAQNLGFLCCVLQCDKDDTKSPTGYVVVVNGGAVRRKSKKQKLPLRCMRHILSTRLRQSCKEAVGS